MWKNKFSEQDVATISNILYKAGLATIYSPDIIQNFDTIFNNANLEYDKRTNLNVKISNSVISRFFKLCIFEPYHFKA